jgi:hypothetical protein
MVRRVILVVLLSIVATAQRPWTGWWPADNGDTVFYCGTVGKFEIRLTLSIDGGGSASGSYQYATQSAFLGLQGYPLSNGKLKVIESATPNVVTGEFLFTGPPLDQLTGTWHSADGKRSYPVHLERIFEEQYDELPEIWSAQSKSALNHPAPGPVLKKLKQIEEAMHGPASSDPSIKSIATKQDLRGPNAIALLATTSGNVSGMQVHIWKNLGDRYQLLYETNTTNGTDTGAYEIESFRFSGEFFIHLMNLSFGTGYLHSDAFLWIAPDTTLHRVGFSPPDTVYPGFQKGESVWKGQVDHFQDDNATFKFGLWREGDANSSPSGGFVKGRYKLTGGKHYNAETKQWSEDFQIVPADFTRIPPTEH